MASHLRNISWSPNGRYLSHSGYDGRLKIWDCTSGVLLQEYTPSSHLSTTCSCLVWRTDREDKPVRKKKKKIHSDTAELIIALGTTTGSILLYSVTKADLQSHLERVHESIVNDICWSKDADSMFSCSDDKYIVEWSVSLNQVKHKWKADRNNTYSVAVVDENTLLSASSSIKWWDIRSRTLLRKFTGHATTVFCLLPVGIPNNTPGEHQYFLSAAIGDRLINAWQLKKGNDPDALASFTLTDEPTSMEVSSAVSKSEKMLLTVVTSTGSLQIFEYQLNGKCKTPSKPKYTIQIAYEEENDRSKRTNPLPILSARISPEDNSELLIAYGTLLRPVFEKIQLTECKKQTILIREYSSRVPSTEKGLDLYKQSSEAKAVTNLVPGILAPLLSSSTKKKRRASTDKDDTQLKEELPFEERITSTGKLQTEEPEPLLSADSMVEVLIQGLQSNDKDLLTKVFDSGDEIARNTVQLLPSTSVQPLLKCLRIRLQAPAYGNRLKYLRWLKLLLSYHTTLVIKCQEIEDILAPVSHLLTSRQDMYQRLLQLKGRLGLILSQIGAGRSEERSRISTEPLVSYREESSSEEEEEDEKDLDLLLSHTDSEDFVDEMEVDKQASGSEESEDSSSEEV